MSAHPCASCGRFGPFSGNQKSKGATRRCTHCVTGGASHDYVCAECRKSFRDQNALDGHMKTHTARSFPCPGCAKMYRGLVDTTRHFESGACDACRGETNARRAAYALVSGQQGGANFLTAAPKLLTLSSGGELQSSGYSADGPNYRCPGCNKTFGALSALMQHTSSRPQCSARGEHLNLRLGMSAMSPPSSTQRMKFFHGTTWDKAMAISNKGFVPSESGCLGRGVYVAREDKARRFAAQRAQETGATFGGLVELLVSVRNPKYVITNDYVWQNAGYDACRAERTSASTNMEWCILSPNQIEVITVTAVTVA